MAFKGEFSPSMDERGRVLLPVKYRQELGARGFLVRGLDGQLNLYPEAVYNRMSQSLEESNQPPSVIRRATRYLNAANEIEPDNLGRILIPASLRRDAGLLGEVILVGNGDHLEIWSPERWHAEYSGWVGSAHEVADDVTRLDLLGWNI